MDGADDGGPSVVEMTAYHSWRHNGAGEGATHLDWGSCGPRRPLGASPYAAADGGAWRGCRWVLCPDGGPSKHPRRTRARDRLHEGVVPPTDGVGPGRARSGPGVEACISFLEARGRSWPEKSPPACRRGLPRCTGWWP